MERLKHMHIVFTTQNISGIFDVILRLNTTALGMNLTAAYKLRVTPQDISLLEDNLTIATWAYDQIRNFRSNAECVEIEAGRRAQTGPGTFIFITPCAEEVYTLIKNNVRALAKQTLASDQTPQAKAADSVNHIPTDPSPYEIPALSLASLRNKGLHLHHDAKGRDAIITPPPQPQR